MIINLSQKRRPPYPVSEHKETIVALPETDQHFYAGCATCGLLLAIPVAWASFLAALIMVGVFGFLLVWSLRRH